MAVFEIYGTSNFCFKEQIIKQLVKNKTKLEKNSICNKPLLNEDEKTKTFSLAVFARQLLHY